MTNIATYNVALLTINRFYTLLTCSIFFHSLNDY